MEKKIDYHSPFIFGNYYHVYNRGNNKELIFYFERNYNYFLNMWTVYFNSMLEVFSYCLMPSHFHFLVRVKDENDILQNISKKNKCNTDTTPKRDSIGLADIKDINNSLEEKFRRFFITYSQAINKEQKRNGSLFQKRFKRIYIDSDSYFIWLVHYIHQNPVHHGYLNSRDTIALSDSISKLPLCSQWKFSSFNAIAGNDGTKVKRDEVLRWFSGRKNFIDFHKEETNIDKVIPYGLDESELE